MLRPFAISSLLMLAFPVLPVQAGEKPWIEVHSPNFRVLTNGSASDARRVAREFEQMRAVFQMAFPNMRLDSGVPLLILAPRDEYSMKAMAPNMWKGGGPKPAGFFQHGWEKQYAVIRLDQDVPGRNNVVYHEYVHTLLHANFRWLPRWLDEGLAEFYGNSRFEESKIYVGAPSTRVFRLRNSPLIKLDELISENPWSRYRKDEQQIDMFYSESWCLVHYFILGPGMEQGKKLNEFYGGLLRGEEQKKAFQEVFGGFKDVEDALADYARRFTFQSMVMQSPPQIKEKDFPSRTMTVAETDAELGTYRLFAHDREDAQAAIDEALRDDPQLGLAHETLGFLEFGEGKDEEARHEFEKGRAADPHLYLSAYYATMLSPLRNSDSPADQLSFRSAMYEVLKANPRFAPAFVELVMVLARQGDYLNALNLARKAEGLQPSRAGYHLLLARLHLALGHNEDAAKEATFVAERWRGPDRDEAAEVINAIPGQKPVLDTAPPDEAWNGTKLSEGTLQSVTCAGKEGTTLVIQGAEGTRTFRSAAGGHMIGYSDTLWFGSDHFSVCHHLNGLRAIVRYKPDADKPSVGEWVELEIREDLFKPQARSNAASVDVKH